MYGNTKHPPAKEKQQPGKQVFVKILAISFQNPLITIKSALLLLLLHKK